jgi:hypothetical protein
VPVFIAPLKKGQKWQWNTTIYGRETPGTRKGSITREQGEAVVMGEDVVHLPETAVTCMKIKEKTISTSTGRRMKTEITSESWFAQGLGLVKRKYWSCTGKCCLMGT